MERKEALQAYRKELETQIGADEMRRLGKNFVHDLFNRIKPESSTELGIRTLAICYGQVFNNAYNLGYNDGKKEGRKKTKKRIKELIDRMEA